MIAKFDGTDEHEQWVERDALVLEAGMTRYATPGAFFSEEDSAWQIWWRDVKRQTWFHRVQRGQVVQIPFDK